MCGAILPEGLCLDCRTRGALSRHLPGEYRHPSYHAHLGHGDYRATIEVIRRRNPLPADLGLVCPAPCELPACAAATTAPSSSGREGAGRRALPAHGGCPKPEIARTAASASARRLRPRRPDRRVLPAHHGHQVEISRRRTRRRHAAATAFRPTCCRPSCSSRSSSRSRCWASPSTTGAEIERLEDFARPTTPSRRARHADQATAAGSKAPTTR